MRELLDTYPYLLGSLSLLVLACLTLWARPEHRRGMVWSGMLSAPCALLAVAFVPHYWQPSQLFRILAGPEDVIFSFANGVVVWGMVAGGDLAIRARPDWTRAAIRLGVVSPSFVLLWLGLRTLGLRLMDGACLSAVTILVFLVLRRPPLWRAAMRGAVLFAAYYLVSLGTLALIVPSFFDQWNHASLSGLRLGQIPIEELLWALLFGAVWPCLMAYLVEEERGFEGEAW